MDTDQRIAAYSRQNGSTRLTATQQRRVAKKAHKEMDPTVGQRARLRKREDAKRRQQLRRNGSALVGYLRARRNGWRPNRRDAA